METVLLSGKKTSRLGFGGSLLGSTARSESKRLLDAAFDLGIRHFDVAPMYGFGKAERLLGEAFRGRTDQITMTTKYGLNPPKNSGLIAPLHRLARNMLKTLPAVKKRLQAASARAQASTAPLPPLTAVEAQASLEQSLKELGVSKIDLFLLHEASPDRLVDDSLLEFLEKSKSAGKIGQYGIGSESKLVKACLLEKPAYCQLVQFEWSIFSVPSPELDACTRIQHGSLGGRRAEFTEWLLADKARCDRWSQATGVDLRQPRTISRLMFKASLLHNPESIVLFSTKSIGNIEDNVKTAADTSIDRAARVFHELAQQEYSAAV